MKIESAKVLLNRPERNFVTPKTLTGRGVYGIGDATLNGSELAVARLEYGTMRNWWSFQ